MFCPPELHPEFDVRAGPDYGWNLGWYNEYVDYIESPNARGIPSPIKDYNNLHEINKNNKIYAKSKVFGIK
jgi:hypothetical protein